MSTTTEDKQKFLRENIIAKGLNGDKFSSFLETTTEGTFNIDDCTIEELRQLVEGFENDPNQESVKKQNVHYPADPTKQDQDGSESDEDINIGNSVIGDVSLCNGFFKTLRVSEIIPNILSEAVNPKVTIGNPEKHSSNNIL